MGGGGGGGSGPTLQQQQLQTQQAITTAELNVQENQQRKSILNAMQGIRVFRGSALSRAMAGNAPGGTGPQGGPSTDQTIGRPIPGTSILDTSGQTAAAAPGGSTPAGGAGASGGGGSARGGGGTGSRTAAY